MQPPASAINQGEPRPARRPFFSLPKPLASLFASCSKTQHCKHQGPCLQSLLEALLRNFGIGFLIKAGISVLFSVGKIVKSPKMLFKAVLDKENAKFGLFLAAFAVIFKGVVCLCRRAMGRDTKRCTFLAGFLAGALSVKLLNEGSGKTLTLFLFARALDAIYQSLVQKQIIPKWEYDYVLLYSVLMMITGYAYANEPGCMSDDMNRFYLKFTNEAVNDLQMRSVWIEQKNRQLALKGIAPLDTLQYMPKLKRFYEGKK